MFDLGRIRVDQFWFGFDYSSSTLQLGLISNESSSNRFRLSKVQIESTSDKARLGQFGYGLGHSWLGYVSTINSGQIWG